MLTNYNTIHNNLHTLHRIQHLHIAHPERKIL